MKARSVCDPASQGEIGLWSDQSRWDQSVIRPVKARSVCDPVLRVSFQHPVRIVVTPESAVMSIDKTIQFKSSFIWENYNENKIRVIISFSHHDVAEFHTIKIIFAQLLYQMNFIRMELDFLQNSLHRHATNIMLLICCANTEVDIFDKWLCNIQLFFFTDIGRPGIWRFFTLPVSLKRLTVRSTVDLEMAVFSSRKVSLKICLTSLYDLWRSPHPRIMRRDILSRSER